jgi:hypothetical protein
MAASIYTILAAFKSRDGRKLEKDEAVEKRAL